MERRLGQGFVVKAEDQKPPEPSFHGEDVLYAKAGLEVWYVSANASKVSRQRGRVIILMTHSPRFRTPSGIHVGSSAAELQTLKGVECAEMPNLDCQHGGHVHNQPATMFQLSGPGGVVVRIAVAYAD